MPISKSFTLTAHNGVLRSLDTPCGISQGFDPASGAVPPKVSEFKALWDTGATSTVITQNVVDACGLSPVGLTKVEGLNSSSMAERYLVNVALPNGVGFMHVSVIKGNLPSGGCDVLIGMDIITSGDFSITNKNGITIFSFRHPSMKHVDFVKEHEIEARRELLDRGGSKKKGKRKKKPKKFGKNKK